MQGNLVERKNFDEGESKNDYCQNFVNTGERPQNFIRDDPNERYENYPKLKDLIKLKEDVIKARATPPRVMKVNLKKFDLGSIDQKFDVIYIDPPWEEYQKRILTPEPKERLGNWSFSEIGNINVEAIAGSPSFVFLWVGTENFENGRELLAK